VILGTDTDAGKTTLALLLLAAFPDVFEYWKPIETGDPDSERVRRLVPGAVVHPPLARFQAPVAPPLAARQEGRTIPLAHEIVAARPRPTTASRRLLIETFGSPFSPLNEEELLLALIQNLACPTVLVSSSAVGAIGRTLQGLRALEAYAIHPRALVLVGPPDPYAVEELLALQQFAWVLPVQPPESWDPPGVAAAAVSAGEAFHTLRGDLESDQYDGSYEAHVPTGVTGQAAELVKRDAWSVWHPYTSRREPDPPLACVGAQDEFLYLADGRKVIDGISSWWTILHGHRHPPLMAALARAMKSYDHVHFAGVTHPPAIALAELLLRSSALANGRVFYSDNGSTAVEVALKMAYQYWCLRGEPKRTAFIGFEHGYHGDTFGAMAVSRDPVFFGRFEPLLFQAEIIPLAAERLDEVLTRRKREVAAVIVEPLVQGAGGMRMHSATTLRDIDYVATQKHEVLLIVDEVMTGGGRTGELWAHQSARIYPDILCAAKTLAGGILPLAATLVSATVADAWDTNDPSRTFFHGHSFTAHPLACSVALANWQALTAGVHPAPARMEAFWTRALALLRDHPRVRDVRVRGTIAAVELDVPGGYLADVGRQLRRHCLGRGVLLRPLGNVLYALPPFCTSDASLEQIADAMIGAVRAWN
jgi:adenosylmethionine-8-amino-7-oxononanoate aminotransferase